AFRLRHIMELPDLSVFRVEGATRRVNPPKVPLNLDELVAMMEASRPKHRAMWAVQAGQGLRPSELMRVQWGDIDFAVQTMTVRGEKTESAWAEVPLTPIARRELLRWRAVAVPEPTPEGVVFPARNTGEPYTSISGYKTALHAAARRAGITRAVDPYLLRASFATIAWSIGMEEEVAQIIMRHTDEKMLRRVYRRPRPADLVERARMFDVPEDEDDKD
ncbi:MAG: site-specific integrase, partial [Myxococcota bacterium]